MKTNIIEGQREINITLTEEELASIYILLGTTSYNDLRTKHQQYPKRDMPKYNIVDTHGFHSLYSGLQEIVILKEGDK